MRVLAHVHLYPPSHNAGAEWALHSTLRHLRAEYDADVSVITNRPPRRHDTFQGVRVSMIRDPRRARSLYRDADVIVTHLDATRQAIACAQRERRPLVHLVHNDRQLAYHRVTREEAHLVCFNSRWIAGTVEWDGPSMVLHPPVWVADYRPAPGPHDAVLLLNLAAAKGARTFYALAARFPTTRFVGVRGAYATQTEPPRGLSNVSVVENTPDVAALYAQARVVLMPSHYESWGRVAVEAAAARVPTLAAPTPGLRETGVPAGFAAHDDIDEWERLLRRLLNDDDAWGEAATRAHARAVALEAESRAQLADLAERLGSLC